MNKAYLLYIKCFCLDYDNPKLSVDVFEKAFLDCWHNHIHVNAILNEFFFNRSGKSLRLYGSNLWDYMLEKEVMTIFVNNKLSMEEINLALQ
jgi:hypothetical protein